jgi:hypothetical protein
MRLHFDASACTYRSRSHRHNMHERALPVRLRARIGLFHPAAFSPKAGQADARSAAPAFCHGTARVPDDVPAWLGLSAGGRRHDRGAGQVCDGGR